MTISYWILHFISQSNGTYLVVPSSSPSNRLCIVTQSLRQDVMQGQFLSDVFAGFEFKVFNVYVVTQHLRHWQDVGGAGQFLSEVSVGFVI